MKLILTIAAYLFCCQIVLTQDTREFKDYYSNGQLKTEGQYSDKKPIGSWKDYYESGQIRREYSYTDGKQDKEAIWYYENGNVKSKTEKRDGRHVTLGYYKTGELFYEQMLKDGYYKEYRKDKTLKVESNYLDYQLSGTWIQYYNNGNAIEWKVDYVNGYRNGTYKNYYENGTLKIEGKISENKKNGEEKHFTENGLLKWKGYYENDMFNKTWIRYNADGKKVEKIKFKAGIASEPEMNFMLTPTQVPDGVLENVPVYPGCEDFIGNRAKKFCMSDKIARFVNVTFNIDLAYDLNLSGRQRIYVMFKIDKSGNVIEARARAPHPKLEAEAIRVVNLLPQLSPGLQRGKEVIVPYSLPILFQVQ
ncbi:energy transducer TonB [uncultured Psychroserpens sp.]|uniref:energy transducer TonB n=1 Tax=uncultured Psychroserpens sp. TaxID=255436 RepID=UPI0026241CFE|nr:energy transducer TonB [uncultured Psychroserpens sp.]